MWGPSRWGPGCTGDSYGPDSNAMEGISSQQQDRQINPIKTILYHVILVYDVILCL